MKMHTTVILLLLIAGMSFIGGAIPPMITAIVGEGHETQIAAIVFGFGFLLFFPAALRLIYLSHVHEGKVQALLGKEKEKR